MFVALPNLTYFLDASMTRTLKEISIDRFGYIYNELVSLASWVMSDSRLSRSAATEPISALLLQFAKYISLV